MPSLLMMIFGGLAALYALYVFIASGSGATQLALRESLENPQLGREVRELVLKWTVPAIRIYSVMGLTAAGLLILAGFRMRNLKSYGLAIAACVFGILPCTNWVCCLTLPVAVWTLTVLTRPEIKSSFT